MGVEKEPGPSGQPGQTAPVSPTEFTATSPTAASTSQLTTTSTTRQSGTRHNISCPPLSNSEVNHNPLTENGGASERGQAGPMVHACGGRGGGMATVGSQHEVSGTTDAKANFAQVMGAYEGYQEAIGQVLEELRDIKQLQRSLDHRMERHNNQMDQVFGVLRDINTTLCRAFTQTPTPPCDTTTSVPSTSVAATEREALSGVDSPDTPTLQLWIPTSDVGWDVQGNIQEGRMARHSPPPVGNGAPDVLVCVQSIHFVGYSCTLSHF